MNPKWPTRDHLGVVTSFWLILAQTLICLTIPGNYGKNVPPNASNKGSQNDVSFGVMLTPCVWQIVHHLAPGMDSNMPPRNYLGMITSFWLMLAQTLIYLSNPGNYDKNVRPNASNKRSQNDDVFWGHVDPLCLADRPVIWLLEWNKQCPPGTS